MLLARRHCTDLSFNWPKCLMIIVSIFIYAQTCVCVEYYRHFGSREVSRERSWHVRPYTALSGPPLMPPVLAGALAGSGLLLGQPRGERLRGRRWKCERDGVREREWQSVINCVGEFGVCPRGLQLHTVQSNREVFTRRGENGAVAVFGCQETFRKRWLSTHSEYTTTEVC